MKPVRITYDPEGDILYITFGQPTTATGYQLSNQIQLWVDPETQQCQRGAWIRGCGAIWSDGNGVTQHRQV